MLDGHMLNKEIVTNVKKNLFINADVVSMPAYHDNDVDKRSVYEQP